MYSSSVRVRKIYKCDIYKVPSEYRQRFRLAPLPLSDSSASAVDHRLPPLSSLRAPPVRPCSPGATGAAVTRCDPTGL